MGDLTSQTVRIKWHSITFVNESDSSYKVAQYHFCNIVMYNHFNIRCLVAIGIGVLLNTEKKNEEEERLTEIIEKKRPTEIIEKKRGERKEKCYLL